MPARVLESGQLYTVTRLDDLAFTHTGELPDIDECFAQPRAVEALRFGLGMPHIGFNLFVIGDSDSRRHALARQMVEEVRQKKAAATDYCYVNNFRNPECPALLLLPAGCGAKFRDDMSQMTSRLGQAISMTFESEAYRARVGVLEEDFKQRQESALREIGDLALAQGIVLIHTPSGFAFSPVREGSKEPLEKKAFEQLPVTRQHEILERIKECQVELDKLLGQLPGWRHELQEALRNVGRDAIRSTVIQLLADLRRRYAELPAVLTFLDAVEADVVESGDVWRETRQETPDTETLYFTGTLSALRYQVNLLVENAGDSGQPVIYEDLPTLPNLLGRVEYVAHMGTLIADFTHIRAGALHRANGGYLMLDAGKLLSQPCAWEGLKRALQSGRIRIESIGEIYGLTSTLQLQPEAIPLQVKIILIGEPIIYYLLAELDPEFSDWFKVAADLDDRIERSPANCRQFACWLATQARQSQLKALDREAVRRLIEHAARLAGDAERLSVLPRALLELMQEADYIAGGSGLIAVTHVEQALAARTRRADRLRERVFEAIQRDLMLIATAGELIGQINGLATIAVAGFVFAHPVRLSAAVRIGDGEMIDIEREIELGGAIHSKGVMILAGFFAARFGRGMPLAFNASLVFEQTYGEVDGDSASLAELCALMSAIGAVPIRQHWAVTGSVNQYGAVQPIGAVNEKIEGFFDICASRGLSGEQGVIIPAANVRDLMLKPAVVEAVAAGRFRIAAVDHVDAAIELLTGLPAGEADSNGIIPEGCINYLVAMHLLELHSMKQPPGEARRDRTKHSRRRRKRVLR